MNMDRLGDSRAELPLTDEDFRTYQLIAEGETPTQGGSVERLLALRLIDPDPYTAGSYIPHDPRAAAQELTAAVLQDLQRVTQRIAHIPALERLTEHFDPQRLYGGPGSEFLPTAAQMNARVGEVGAATATEFCSIQPGEPADRDPEIVRLGVQRTRAVLLEGVEVRSIYHRSACEHTQTADQVGQMIEDGAEVRASSVPGPRLMIMDRKHLFIENHVIDGAEGNSGWHVFDRASVAWARAIFNLFWDHAERWQDLRAATNASPLTERQRRILGELDAGYSQGQIGPRIGLSRSAVDKEIAAIRATLGFRTTFQVMAWYGRTAAKPGVGR